MSVMVLDGGMGRELLRIGAPFRQPEWSALALLDGPDWVVQAHTNFIHAGAQLITTNSYAVVPFHIGDERFAARGHELAELSGRLARTAASAANSPVLVAGSLPPLFGSYRPDLFDWSAAPGIIDITFKARNHVYVKVEHSLTGRSAIVEPDVVARRAELAIKTFLDRVDQGIDRRTLLRSRRPPVRHMPLGDDE